VLKTLWTGGPRLYDLPAMRRVIPTATEVRINRATDECCYPPDSAK
jgi:hypothetical protein